MGFQEQIEITMKSMKGALFGSDLLWQRPYYILVKKLLYSCKQSFNWIKKSCINCKVFIYIVTVR